MAKFRCWSAEKVSETVFSDIGALDGDADAIFLAAHTPVDLAHPKGTEVDQHASGEKQVLDALLGQLGDTERNTLIAITGGSGSGKSHVVRWVNAHVSRDDDRYRVLYVPRAIQTLRSLLHRIVTDLPGVEGTELLKRVDDAIGKASPGQLKDQVVNEMKIALNWTIQKLPAEDGETPDEAQAREDRNNLLGFADEEGRRRDGLADLLEEPMVSKALLRKGGRLDRLVASYFDETSRRDDSEEVFSENDLPVRELGVRRALKGRPDLLELWEMVAHDSSDALSLLEDALRKAVPGTVGLRGNGGGDTLDGLFTQSRQILKRDGRELVLIFEDLTQFGLVDGELYDQFATAPSADIAPLRVVFAVTDGAFARMDKTVSTRMSHVFKVGGSAMSDPQKFVGRYLNLVRIGGGRTRALREAAGATDASSWMDNACTSLENGLPCPYIETCHTSFGKVEIDGLGPVGLYPYSAPALRRAIEHLGSDGTPRLVLDECVATNLTEADARIAEGTYPHERVMDRFDKSATMFRDGLVRDVPAAEKDRVYRALLIWGDEKPLKPGIVEAFSLPTRAPGQAQPKPDDEPTPVPQPSTPSTPTVADPLEPLYQWRNGATLIENEVNYYRQTLLLLTQSRLQLDQHLMHVFSGRGKDLLARMFNQTSFHFEGGRGAGAGKDSVRFEIKPTAENVQLLAAARWFRDHGHFDPQRGKWPWPTGLAPMRLMLELEDALDRWAAEVRSRFLAATGGSAIAADAVGLRAVALLASGHPESVLTSTGAVLNVPSVPSGQVTDHWAPVQAAAVQALQVKSGEYVAEFATVRQGATGDAQMVDSIDLDRALAHWLKDPERSLERLQEKKAEAELATRARALLEAIRRQQAGEREAMNAASAYLDENLAGLPPATVGDRALQIGQAASSRGLFRPLNGWGDFQRAVDVLGMNKSAVPPLSVNPDAKSVLRAQNPGRSVSALADALRLVIDSMRQTMVECERSGDAVGDVGALRAEVQRQVAETDRLVKAMARED